MSFQGAMWFVLSVVWFALALAQRSDPVIFNACVTRVVVCAGVVAAVTA